MKRDIAAVTDLPGRAADPESVAACPPWLTASRSPHPLRGSTAERHGRSGATGNLVPLVTPRAARRPSASRRHSVSACSATNDFTKSPLLREGSSQPQLQER